jgi:hypothetical protein
MRRLLAIVLAVAAVGVLAAGVAVATAGPAPPLEPRTGHDDAPTAVESVGGARAAAVARRAPDLPARWLVALAVAAALPLLAARRHRLAVEPPSVGDMSHPAAPSRAPPTLAAV